MVSAFPLAPTMLSPWNRRPKLYERTQKASQGVIQELEKRLAKEQNPMIRQDLEILIKAGRLDEVRAAVAGGDLEVLDGFVDAVHEGLSAEHRQWTEDVGQIGSAIDKLSEKRESVQSGLSDGSQKA